jgi:hypothetical protein
MDNPYNKPLALIDEAIDALTVGHPLRAIWRLIDAAGMLADAEPERFAVGRNVTTGRGYRLQRLPGIPRIDPADLPAVLSGLAEK